jgi:hypothetical protein
MIKKLLYLFVAVAILASCGPHRMKCGARGICEKQKSETFKAA